MRPLTFLVLLLAAGPLWAQGAARLAAERSAYLQAHADNAVDWHPWGPEALALARRLDRPIFLSVGYSTCHWCHVMEHESFMDPAVGKALADGFVAIKLDREERPDLDAQYMLASQILGQQGGWPNSVWLTPELHPFAAATYLPKAAFLGMLGQVAELWGTRRAELEAQGRRCVEVLAKLASAAAPGPPAPLDRKRVQRALAALTRAFDPLRGGIGAAPKFPPHHALRLALDALGAAPDPELAGRVAVTLDRMAAGGIHDQVGGGFHRYATDADWHLPHFEKMLTDNALLLRAYAQAAAQSDSSAWRTVARGIATFMTGELADPSGGFVTALDADSGGAEGLAYTWTLAELEAALGPSDAAFAAALYGATAGGNFADEATRRPTGRNVLSRLDRPEPEGEAARRLDGIRARLLAARRARPAPPRDPWVLADGNGLAIGALAFAGRVLAEPAWIEAAARAARMVLGQLRPDGRLRHAWRDGEARVEGLLDDHAFLADGLLELHQATGDPAWLAAARELAEVLVAEFADPAGGFFRTRAGAEGLLVRPKDPTDAAIPSGDGVATRVLVALAARTGEAAWASHASRSLESWSAFLARAPETAPTLVGALAGLLGLPPGAPGGPAARVRIAPLTLEARPASPVATAGLSLPVGLDLVPDAGWHLAGPAPAPPGLVATTLALDPHPWLGLEAVSYPPPTLRRPASLAEATPLYDGPIRLGIGLAVAAGAPATSTVAVLRLATQACDERRCLEPTTYELAVPLTLARPPPPAR